MMDGYLSSQGYSVDYAHDGAAGLARAYERAYDIVVLDIMLPTPDGFDVHRHLRRRSEVPVIPARKTGSEDSRWAVHGDTGPRIVKICKHL